MNKMTRIELELIPDINIYFFVEKGMREGIYYTAKRSSKPNTCNFMLMNQANLLCI